MTHLHADQQVFDEHRNLPFSVAYRLLGAEDAVQDAWIKWSAAGRSQVADPKAYLARIVSNLAMERLRSTRRRRETYVGLPEPLLTSGDTADDVAGADSVSMAMLVVLETLPPATSARPDSRARARTGHRSERDAKQVSVRAGWCV
ncbi:sigma factor [Sphaerisporangium sp. NPDC004334]